MKKDIFPVLDIELLRRVQSCAQERKAKPYLVGGVLRDMYVGRRKENPDFDFALKRGAIAFARDLAGRLRAGFFILDKETGSARVVKKTVTGIYTLDFTDFRGPALEDDLAHRDFTIDALALELGPVLEREPLDKHVIDPHGGRRDIRARCIRMVRGSAFPQDPLRILRAFSLSSLLDFVIDERTLKAAARGRRALTRVSPERVRDELFKIFSRPGSARYLRQMDELKILEVVIPEIVKMRRIGQGPYHHLDVWQHTLETVSQLDGVLKHFSGNEDIAKYLDVPLGAGRKRSALLVLAALLHDIAKPATMKQEKERVSFHGHEWVGMRMAATIAERLKLSRDEVHALKSIVAAHLRPGFLSDVRPLTPRAVYRFFRDARQDVLGVLLVSLADQRATHGPLHTKESHRRHERTVRRLLNEYFKKEKESGRPRLVNGHEIMKALKLQPSPAVGKILSELQELQAIGTVTTKAHALREARRILKAGLS